MTYTELVAQVAAFSHRADLASLMPTFVGLAEDKLNRALRVRQMEEALPVTAIDAFNEVALPSDFLAMKHLWATDYPQARLKPQTLEAIVSRNRFDGTPTAYAVTGSALKFDGSGDVQGVYFKRLPSLVSNSTNWLSEAHPDVYLWATLEALSSYTLDAGQGALFSAKAGEAVQGIQGADMRDRFSGQLTASVR
jgi:hypothetical protein